MIHPTGSITPELLFTVEPDGDSPEICVYDSRGDARICAESGCHRFASEHCDKGDLYSATCTKAHHAFTPAERCPSYRIILAAETDPDRGVSSLLDDENTVALTPKQLAELCRKWGATGDLKI